MNATAFGRLTQKQLNERQSMAMELECTLFFGMICSVADDESPCNAEEVIKGEGKLLQLPDSPLQVHPDA
eukprot:1157031-Pelagomonas_calceolata.AAC.7